MKNPLLGDGAGLRKPGSPACTLDLEMVEMNTVMQDRIPEEAKRKEWLESYRQMRRSMIWRGDVSESALSDDDRAVITAVEKPAWETAKILPPLPEDIRLYLEGALLYPDATGRADEASVKQAREKWMQLLALPVEQRKWRSTWAAWMLFRTCGPEDKAECGRWLAETCKLSQAGLADCLHLGIEATYILGRPASDLPEKSQVTAAEWKRAAYLRAILGHSRAEEQVRRFDRWEHTAWSEELAAQTLADPLLRQAQLLHLIEVAQGALGWDFGHHQAASAMTNPELKDWLASFEKAEMPEHREATLLAWLHYNAARFDEAGRWLKLAPKDDVVALSLRGKLAAMTGKKAETVKTLKALAMQMPEIRDETRANVEIRADFTVLPLPISQYEQVRRHHFLADYGRAQLAVNDFTGALQTFSQTDFWDDAAYIAEKLMSVEELLALQREGLVTERMSPLGDPAAQPPEPAKTLQELVNKYGRWSFPQGQPMMKYLVGRRLAREQYFKNARSMLPYDLAAGFGLYAEACRQGHDRKLPKTKRAQALWQAAQIHRLLGLELFGYETGPDYFSTGANFELRDLAKFRNQKVWTDDWIYDNRMPESAQQAPTFAATSDEIWRARHYGPKVDKRFHYRYTAAGLAWDAAALMPDDDPKTAEVLCIAGNWLKKRDAQAADRFYKALVRRNPSVPLAQEAEKKRWFPEVEWKFDLELPES